MNSYKKVKPAAKVVLSDPESLTKKITYTMSKIEEIVGATLGPSGKPVLIERQEYGLPNIFTKDGVTVFRNLGFRDPLSQSVLESARDAANRTVAEAGDGTTTATVLANALIKNINSFVSKNPKYTPQKIVRQVQTYFNKTVEPFIKSKTVKQDSTELDFSKLLHNVATVSANGDTDVSDAVMKCFDLTGDKGAIVLTEQSGPSGYEVEHIEGFPVEMGYEESLRRYATMYVNDKSNNRVYLENPVFVLSAAPVTEPQTIQILMETVGRAWEDPASAGLEKPFTHNIVLVAPGFSDGLLGALAVNWQASDTINILPMLCPKTLVSNSEMHFLDDLAAVTGASIFNPMTKPISTGTLSDLGYGIKSIEMNRFRTMVIGMCEEQLVDMQMESISASIPSAESKLDKQILEDRVARLNGGICKLKVSAPSSVEIRERKDRAEDAIAAVRGAIKHGVLPGACSTLLQLYLEKSSIDSQILEEIIKPTLLAPLERILNNAGYTEEEISKVFEEYWKVLDKGYIFDAFNGKFGDAYELGILDSTPAVLESIRNSFSIASNLGTMGGIIVFERDDVLEREEASQTNHFLESTGLEGKEF